jgi:hypothetical protein
MAIELCALTNFKDFRNQGSSINQRRGRSFGEYGKLKAYPFSYGLIEHTEVPG